jgi:hypothetical protein
VLWAEAQAMACAVDTYTGYDLCYDHTHGIWNVLWTQTQDMTYAIGTDLEYDVLWAEAYNMICCEHRPRP